MIRLAAALACLWASQAAADDYPASLDLYGDTIQITEGDTPYGAVVTYSNSIKMVSSTKRHTLQVNGIIVDVHIEVVKGRATERFTVTPRDPGLIAYPSELDVADGETAAIQVMVPMF